MTERKIKPLSDSEREGLNRLVREIRASGESGDLVKEAKLVNGFIKAMEDGLIDSCEIVSCELEPVGGETTPDTDRDLIFESPRDRC